MTKLILFPYAGSLGIGYNQWLKQLKERFDTYRLNYTELKPGLREYNCHNWEELCELLFEKVRDIVKDGDYVFFGHSMGSRTEYEMYRQIVKNQLPLPKKIYFSGCTVLTKPTKDPSLSSEAEFREEYSKLGGISDEVLACKELADLAFAELRKEVQLLSQYRYEPIEMKCPVTVLNGDRDKYSSKESWEEVLGCNVDWNIYNGKHFFIYDHQDEIFRDLFSLTDK